MGIFGELHRMVPDLFDFRHFSNWLIGLLVLRHDSPALLPFL
ncbi:hypothetical protein D187_005491 [Cystobacter fuscus DSM 2262]|uniref:Uncharacterized protein n=1 Tax=Cystobacter fuscus (strain ATCC 25194 / DSM 2262 / NBRC 100088 / M29) TaxID=1242864 RepID=S9PPE7_CYSF2|nr:hypothetical protein D187_005491 [Cystobacter fuscus DSM 2262]